MIYYIAERIKDLIPSSVNPFHYMLALKGKIFREQKNRKTMQVSLGNKTYFIKQHLGVGWLEIIKNLLQLKLPVLGAKNEWLAILYMQQLKLSVPTLYAYGERGINPATQQSFVLMEDITPAISLEDLTRDWRVNPPAVSLKRALILAVAHIAKTMHQNGINHRDFYLCHFLLKQPICFPIALTVIDLHRAQIRHLTPSRWIIKDLAGLYFSSKDIGLTQRDLYRFALAYSGCDLRKLSQEYNFWGRILKRGEQLYRDHAIAKQ